MNGAESDCMVPLPVDSVLGKLLLSTGLCARRLTLLQVLQLGRLERRMDSRNICLVPPEPCPRCQTAATATTGGLYG